MQSKHPAGRHSNGFSLVELLIVVAIIAVLGAIAMPVYRNYISAAKTKAAEAVLEQFPVLLEEYRAENGSFPPDGTYTYTETADGTATDEITATPVVAGTAAGLTGFSPRSATYPTDKGILFNYSLTISNSGTATETATYSATGVREGAGINVGPFTYQ